MSAPTLEKDEAVNLLLRDIEVTLGDGYEELVRTRAAELLTFLEDPAGYIDRLVQDIQQHFHDCRVDTVWPRCPLHSSHPLWLHDEHWVCEREKAVIARLGSLKGSI